MDKKAEIIRLAAELGIKETHFSQSPDTWDGPADLRGSVDIGECPFSWHFYDYKLDGAMDKALAWLKKPKPKCVCEW